jgi:MFS family permease
LETGLRFLRGKRILLGAITLDMFAVLFGGAVALLPIYATDILKVDATGLGLMRTAPSVGALLMALTLARLGPIPRSGWVLLLAVAGFGVATVIFGISTSFWLSLLMLALTGALDNISVVVRSTLFMTTVPDEMRGRVGAVNWIFIGISNEMGSFESGLAAALLGPVWAVVTGGIGTMIVVGLVARLVPELRRMDRLGGHST